MTVVWVEHSHSTDQGAHTAIYSISAGMSFVVCCLYLVSGIHKRCSGSIIVKRVFCDLAYFTVMAISSDIGLGKQAIVNGNPTMIFDKCEYTAPIATFFRLASVLWFAIQIHDLRAAIATPFVFRNTAKTAHWYWLFVWGICSVFVVLGFYPPLGGYHDTGDSWGSNMEGDCGYAAWENWYSPWVIGLQILPYALVFVLSINTLRKAKTYLTAGCRRTRLVRNRMLAQVTLQIATWSVYYGLGAIIVVAAAARRESDDLAEPWEYVWSDTGRGWALGVIVWRSLRAWLINPFLLVVDIGVLDGWLVRTADGAPSEVATAAIAKIWHKLKKGACCQNVKAAVLDAGSMEYDAQLAAREDVLTCVMKGVVDSTKRTAELFDKPAEGGAAGGDTALFQRDGSMTQEEEMGRKQIQRVVSGQEDSAEMVPVHSDGVNYHRGFTEHNLDDFAALRASDAVARTDASEKAARMDSDYEGSLFSEHLPLVAHWIRNQLGISATDFVASMQSKDGTINQMAEKFTEGRSNSFFYFTQDRRYMVKTCTASDHAAIVANMCNYAMYLETGVNSLLNRIVGCYQLQFHPEEALIYVIVIANIMWAPSCPKPALSFKFDLKGSTIERQEIKDPAVITECQQPSGSFEAILKDTDLLNLNLKPTLSRQAFLKLSKQMKLDVKWLRENNIMDYSLLLAVSPKEASSEQPGSPGENPTNCGAVGSTDQLNPDSRGWSALSDQGPSRHSDPRFFCKNRGGIEGTIFGGREVVLYIGIIDISQEFDFSKKGEQCLKTKLLCRDANGISCCPVEEYSERFLKVILSYFAPDELSTPRTNNADHEHIGINIPMVEIHTETSSEDEVGRWLDTINPHAQADTTEVEATATEVDAAPAEDGQTKLAAQWTNEVLAAPQTFAAQAELAQTFASTDAQMSDADHPSRVDGSLVQPSDPDRQQCCANGFC